MTTPKSPRAAAHYAGCSDWMQTARPSGLQVAEIRQDGSLTAVSRVSKPGMDGEGAGTQASNGSRCQVPAARQPYQPALAQCTADPDEYLMHSHAFSKTHLRHSIHCFSTRDGQRGVLAAQTVAPAQDRPFAEPTLQARPITSLSALS